MSDTVVLGDVVVIGGGCYGTFYAGQLAAARERGKATYRRVLVVDRDPACRMQRELGEAPGRQLVVAEWDDFLDRYLGGGESGREEDVIVPSPLMPHLMYGWLLRRARVRWPDRAIETQPVRGSPGTPYDTAAPDGTRYVSFADWLCPTHCVEPATCPVIRGPRTWEMADAVKALAARLAAPGPVVGPILFTCRHTVFGVGTFSVASVLEGDQIVAAAGTAGTERDLVVGTISSCHGALNVLHLGPAV